MLMSMSVTKALILNGWRRKGLGKFRQFPVSLAIAAACFSKSKFKRPDAEARFFSFGIELISKCLFIAQCRNYTFQHFLVELLQGISRLAEVFARVHMKYKFLYH